MDTINLSIFTRDVENSRNMERGTSAVSHIATEKKIRREIANSNERRRMQSINAGFQSLKGKIPHNHGEKMSKASILQSATEYIASLEQQNNHMYEENVQMKQMLTNIHKADLDKSLPNTVKQESPPPKRQKRDTESSDEGIGLRDGDFVDDPLDEKRAVELMELRSELDREQKLRKTLEHEIETLRQQMSKQMTVANHCTHQGEAMGPTRSTIPGQCVVKQETPAPDVPTLQTSTLPGPAPAQVAVPAPPPVTNSTSHRNLLTILEAIWHLEGRDKLNEGDTSHCPSGDSHMRDDSETDSDIEGPVNDVTTVKATVTQHPVTYEQHHIAHNDASTPHNANHVGGCTNKKL